jgi:hypothetical protein
MVPAVLIYALFPKQPIGVKGPLGALTISATGAFAAYVIVFALAYPIVSRSEDLLSERAMSRSVWDVSAEVSLVDESGHQVNPLWLSGLVVQLRPDFYDPAGPLLKMSIPEINGSLPNIVLSVPKFGSEVINTSDMTKLSKDDLHKKIQVNKVVIKKIPELAAGVGAATPD